MKNEIKTYLVGGSVRDSLLGKPPKDRDFVVVGGSDEQMIAAGFKRVGADFPVYLDEFGEEYALARTERSTGAGYKDFTFDTNGVTLEDDLRRRDLTINAMAIDPNAIIGSENIIDPFGGQSDLKNHILRHVCDDGFVEDPLRVVRLARFCAKFPSFTVDKNTINLCKKIVDNGMLNALTAERVAGEMLKAFECEKPSRFFVFLEMIGALEILFPEIHALAIVPAGPYIHHPEGDAFIHTMMVVDQMTADTSYLSGLYRQVMIFCALTHDLGKGTTDWSILPHHYGHEERGVPLVEAMCNRLKLANEFRNYGKLVARFHTHVHNVMKLNPKTIVSLYDQLKVNSNKHIIAALTVTSRADARGRGSFYSTVAYPQADIMAEALIRCQINARDVCTEEELQNVNIIKTKLQHARVAAVKAVKDKYA